MAEGKKSFIVYSDWKETFDNLPDEVAGKLIKHIFSYVNDENPTTDDFVINALFSNIKNTLKRDLNKWEKQIEQRIEAGRRSAELRKNKINDRSTKTNDRSISLNENQRNSTDSVNDNVNVSVNDILLEKETKDIRTKKNVFNPPSEKEVIDYFFENGYNQETAKKAFQYYAVANWIDSNGKKIKNWKQKMISVWFKDENRIATPKSNLAPKLIF